MVELCQRIQKLPSVSKQPRELDTRFGIAGRDRKPVPQHCLGSLHIACQERFADTVDKGIGHCADVSGGISSGQISVRAEQPEPIE